MPVPSLFPHPAPRTARPVFPGAAIAAGLLAEASYRAGAATTRQPPGISKPAQNLLDRGHLECINQWGRYTAPAEFSRRVYAKPTLRF